MTYRFFSTLFDHEYLISSPLPFVLARLIFQETHWGTVVPDPSEGTSSDHRDLKPMVVRACELLGTLGTLWLLPEILDTRADLL